jgi:hypothetical protein
MIFKDEYNHYCDSIRFGYAIHNDFLVLWVVNETIV